MNCAWGLSIGELNMEVISMECQRGTIYGEL